MYYSYVMGMNEEIYALEKEGFIIEKDDNDFMITFNKDMAITWEDFIYKHLKVEFWNEYKFLLRSYKSLFSIYL